MNYDLSLNDRPFYAIKAGTKKIEGRTPKDRNDHRYEKMTSGDTITFTNNVTNEKLACAVLSVEHYSDTRLMLEAEGAKNVFIKWWKY